MKIFGFIAFLIAVFLAFHVTTTRATADNLAATRIEADEEAGVIRFIVEGEERAVLDVNGLHVNGSIEYTGTLTDIGSQAHSVGDGGAR